MAKLPAATLTNLRTDLKKAEDRKAALKNELVELQESISFMKKILNEAEKGEAKHPPENH